MKKRVVLQTVALAALIAGCGVNDAQLSKATERLDKLTSSGLPDSLLSDAKCELYDAKQAKEDGQAGAARDSYKRAIAAMSKAEKILAQSLSEKKPQVVKRLADLKAACTELKGMHQTEMNTVLDSLSKLIEKDWIIEAERQATIADTLLATLKSQQGQAEQISGSIAGTWKFEKTYSSSVDYTVDAKEEKIFTFQPDGKATFVEQKKGKSSHTLKEDYRFESYGTWGIKGDTIHIKTSRFVCVRQNFLEEQNGKWVPNNKPAYDSTITDGSQDRYITFNDLKQDFKKQ